MEVVSVEHEYEYTTKKGHLVSIKPNENYLLVSRTNEHWWHVRKDPDSKPFYVPAQYMKRSPSDKENSQLTSSLQKQKCPKTTLKEKTGSNTVRNSFGQYRFSTFGLSLPDDEPKEQIPNKDNDHLNLKPKGQQPVKEEVKLRLKTFQSQVETMQDDSFEFPAPPTATLFLDVDGPEPSQESDTKSGLNDAREVGDTRGMEGERQAERAGGPHLRKAKHYSVFSALGSTSVFLSYSFWDKEDFYSFQLFCVALATFSVLGFFFVSRLLRRRFQSEIRPKLDEAQTLKELSVSPPHSQSGKSVTVGQYLRQLSKHKNFMWFVSMNLIQVFHCHFNSNFFPLFLEHLLSDHISASTGSILLGISYVAPHLNNLYFLTLCQSNRVFTEGTCKLLKLVISDLVDEDFVLHRRQQATSALLFGMVALLTKPGQTFAPLIGTWLLCVYTGYDIFQRHPVKDPVAEVAPAAGTPPLRIGCFHMLVFVPITCALLQLAAWSRFTLHGRKLQGIKTLRQGALHSHPIDVKAI